MAKLKQPGDGGISNPVMYKTEEEASAAAIKAAAIDEMLINMSPEERAEWFANIAGSNPEDVE